MILLSRAPRVIFGYPARQEATHASSQREAESKRLREASEQVEKTRQGEKMDDWGSEEEAAPPADAGAEEWASPDENDNSDLDIDVDAKPVAKSRPCG